MPSINYTSFGDVYKYREKDFILLIKKSDSIFVAEILCEEETVKRNRMINNIAKNPQRAWEMDNVLLCIVELRNTEEYKDRAAYYGNPERGDLPEFFSNCVGKIDNSDAKKLLKELLSDELHIPPILKEELKKLSI